MQRLRSTFNLLSDENPQLLKDGQENSYNHLEHSSWSQILSSETPSQDIHASGQKIYECASLPDEQRANGNATEFQGNFLNRSDQHDVLRCNIPEYVHRNIYLKENSLDDSSSRSECVITHDERRRNPQNRFDAQAESEHLQNILKNAFQIGDHGGSSLMCNACEIPPGEFRNIICDPYNQQDDFEHRHNNLESSHRDDHSVDVSPANFEYVIPTNKHRSNVLDRFSNDVQNTFEHRHNIQKNSYKNDYLEDVLFTGSERMLPQEYCSNTSNSKECHNIQGQQDVFEKWNTSQQSDASTRGLSEEVPHSISSTESEISCAFARPVSETVQVDIVTIPTPYPVVNPFGHASLLLRHLVRVDISPDEAVYIHNFPGQSVVALRGNKICVFHPNGRVFIDGHIFHIITCQNRIAKICQRGVVFSSSSRSLAYRVDESGTKTTADKFLKLRDDLPTDVFRGDKLVFNLEKCSDMVQSSTHVYRHNGDDIWVIGGVQVKQDCYGNIEVSVGDGRRVVRILPVIREISVASGPYFIVSVGCYSKRYLTVQAGNRRVTSSTSCLMVRNGSQKAGIDRSGKVVIF